ncbi:Carbamoyl-phosphate synthase small chain [Roseomonas mucosa]|uniref:Carbamoyl phosphate synthase small chain n=4 Tax=Roseomonas mucosa TaxID=207340 RepID=A0A379MUY9_9PROT|nr:MULTISPECIES: glutamine-hydrolyzing carbamoyl-phosphate synthase small subunit [Roseomonas]MBS5902493.1 glutamine-hydrolyzing carbamoyl-phosphate synthase small subunit [Acetobacteraceae bacterium]MDT8289821.1 glutamine-hydrolyzing carbamoyl-phosphate synthase small subunit [Roseomonas mucosa]MDT8295266.1 glutamine-hydrolyzing carbamoyl-phosphate synthase small subunit [Roseomonas mucosa]MDT8312805.1 glutamine-hydrolyzing carbamoyl-phosphate synthase small subunit [Roseomonas mucosa]MDT8349
MRSVEEIIRLAGGAEAVASRCGVGSEAVRKWRQARAIPPKHWPALLAATGLSFGDMPGASVTVPADPATSSPSPTAAEPSMPEAADTPPAGATACIVLMDGTVFWGRGFGAAATRVGEICFNTGLTGYQETLTDPSYAGQIITFTFPHIGNVGANAEDVETVTPAALGLITKADVSEPSNYRAQRHLDDWLKSFGIPGIAGVDTRALTIRIRDGGAPNGVICHAPDGNFDLASLRAQAAGWPGLEGMDLAKEVSCQQSYRWEEGLWRWNQGYDANPAKRHKVVAVDYGAKRNILRCLADAGCDVTVVPATATAEEILRHGPDGVFLSNGPGDPAATGEYAVPAIRGVLEKQVPVFGICLGHQLLALALGARTYKLDRGHRGANQPVKDLATGKVEITSQNHGFAVDDKSLPEGVKVTHVSLFDGSNEGIACEDKRAFSVQYHPEASPGPSDSHYLFHRFTALIESVKEKAA